MKKISMFFAAMLVVAMMTGYALAHCGSCGVEDGYVCAKDNVASTQAGSCSACGAELAKGDIKEVSADQPGGQITYVPASAAGK